MFRNSNVFFTGDAINTSDGKFWINKETSAYCADGVEDLIHQLCMMTKLGRRRIYDSTRKDVYTRG